MSIRNIARRVMRAYPAIAKMTPAGRIASIATKATAAVKRVAQVGLSTTPSIMTAVQRLVGKKKRKKHKGISEREMLELLKLQMFVSKKSIPYQVAVMKAISGKLK